MSAYGKVAANGNSVRVRAKYNNTDIEAINFTSLDYTYQSIETYQHYCEEIGIII